MALGGFGPALAAIPGVSSLLSALGIPLDLAGADSIYKVAEAAQLFTQNQGRAWTYSGQDWYKVFPYSFVVEAKQEAAGPPAPGGENPSQIKTFTYTLPIPPQSMMTKMIPASAATATLGGVVEETSDNVFWIIQMSGTTGVGVSREGVTGPDADRKDVAKKFRKKLETTGLLSGVAAQLNTLVGKVGGTADAVIGAAGSFASGDIAGGIGGVVGAINNAILPQLPYSGSSVDDVTNGYTEMQEFHRFLYTFSHLRAQRPKDFVLKFLNYKTAQQWRIALQDFSIQQSAQNPHLYRYNIQFKAWGVKDIAETDSFAFDRFGPGGDLKPVNTVGADGLYKAFKAISGTFKGESANTVADAYLKPLGS